MAVRRDQRHRDVPAARGGAPARQAAAPRLDRRGLRRPGARRPGALHRADAVQPVEPLLRDEGVRGPAGPGLGAVLRHRGHVVELLEQLRALPARREVHPAPDHQRAAGRQAQAVRPGVQRARLDPRRRPQRRGRGGHREGPRRADVPHRRRRGDGQPSGRRAAARADGQAGGLVRPRHRPARPRPALRDRLQQAARRDRLGADVPGHPRRPRRHHRLVPRQRALVGRRQGPHRADLPAASAADPAVQLGQRWMPRRASTARAT